MSVHLHTSLYFVFSCFLVLPLRAPKKEFEPRNRRLRPRNTSSGPERSRKSSSGRKRQVRICYIYIYIYILLNFRTSLYISESLYISFLMISCCACSGRTKMVQGWRFSSPPYYIMLYLCYLFRCCFFLTLLASWSCLSCFFIFLRFSFASLYRLSLSSSAHLSSFLNIC